MIYPLGALIELPDGRRGRIVYNGLEGQGINLSDAPLSKEEMNAIKGTNPLFGEHPRSFPGYLRMRVYLREPWQGADGFECVTGERWIDEANHD